MNINFKSLDPIILKLKSDAEKYRAVGNYDQVDLIQYRLALYEMWIDSIRLKIPGISTDQIHSTGT